MLRFQVCILGHDPALQSGASLTVSFDSAFAQLSLLPRLFIEPDGSFVWRGTDTDGSDWQVDGNLIDRGDVLAYAELSGGCPAERLNDLLRAVGWPRQPLVFQLPRKGVVLDEVEFRRLAASGAGAL